ncbi:hypothetical protein PG991_010193 [Apiospora marii]|uniref:Rhodopsin domain-containing protein n=1 Tax=Apiospora marii TaxID=335849 RepID=A0ABR1RI63_9PEZI
MNAAAKRDSLWPKTAYSVCSKSGAAQSFLTSNTESWSCQLGVATVMHNAEPPPLRLFQPVIRPASPQDTLPPPDADRTINSAMATKQLNIVIALGVSFSLATCALGLRIPARKITKVDLWWDDYCCVAGYVGVRPIRRISDGLGRHLDSNADPEELVLWNSNLLTFFLQLAFTYSITLIKLAILAFYWRVFSTSSIRRPIIALAVLSVGWLLARTFITVFHCIPVQAYWDKSIPGATCFINDAKYIFWSTLAHFLIDVVIIVLPAIEIRKLQQFSTLQKIGTCALFGFGTLVCAASLAVVILAKDANSDNKDLPWNMADIMLWSTVEVNLSVVSACLPLIRPVFITVRKNSFRVSGAEFGAHTVPQDYAASSIYSHDAPVQPPAPPPPKFYRDSKGWLQDRVARVRGYESSIPNFSKPKSIHGCPYEMKGPAGVPQLPAGPNFI